MIQDHQYQARKCIQAFPCDMGQEDVDKRMTQENHMGIPENSLLVEDHLGPTKKGDMTENLCIFYI